MGFFDWIIGKSEKKLKDLCSFLKVSENEIRQIYPEYREFSLAKRSGGSRRIFSPSESLKAIQNRIKDRLLGHLGSHKSCRGFESGESIVTNALSHVDKAVIIKIDVRDFFHSTTSERIECYFRKIGWNKESAKLLTQLTTYNGFLPQGAPTSPRLSNLVNYRLDARLDGLAKSLDADYTRYADDMTFSLSADDPVKIQLILSSTRKILLEYGYRPNKKKLKVLRQHQQQKVTGLIVNKKLQLPRQKRKWLRAVKHRLLTTGRCSLSPKQLQGWNGLEKMVQAKKK
ncbi:MAG: RNA-directed polymerase [Clostridiales bacterium]|nr:RNA-directed polymerase [Clostridiales bacterium]MDN5281786.1 RNA-directed polymerase [Candidatus Ozemobacter sp.]